MSSSDNRKVSLPDDANAVINCDAVHIGEETHHHHDQRTNTEYKQTNVQLSPHLHQHQHEFHHETTIHHHHNVIYMTPFQSTSGEHSNQVKEKFFYRRQWTIAKGCTGSCVYYCKDSNGKDLFAVKVMDMKQYPDAKQELKTLRSLTDSAYLLRYITSGSDDNDRLEIVTELCHGSVQQFIQCCKQKRNGECKENWPKPLPLKEEGLEEYENKTEEDYLSYFGLSPMDIFKNIVQGIFELSFHHGLEHRDIKPSNFLMKKQQDRSVVKVCDFGLTRDIDPNSSVTARGTDSYMPREVIRKERVVPDGKSDVFSLGLVLYNTITEGKHPFGKTTFNQTCNIGNGQDPDFSGLMQVPDAELSQEEKINMRHLLSWMLKHEPDSRPTMQEVKCHPTLWTFKEKVLFLVKVAEIFQPFDQRKLQKTPKRKVEDISSQPKKKYAKLTDRLKPAKSLTKKFNSTKFKKPSVASPLVAGDSIPFQDERISRPSFTNEETEPVPGCSPPVQRSDLLNRIESLKNFRDWQLFEAADSGETSSTKRMLDQIKKEAPCSSVLDILLLMANLNQNAGPKYENIGLGSTKNWKQFYNYFSKDNPNLLLRVYELFWDFPELGDFEKGVLEKDRGPRRSKRN